MPTVIDIAVYLFVNALTTVSAVIFLYDTTAAAAMATLILITALGAKVLHLVVDQLVLAKLQTWRSR